MNASVFRRHDLVWLDPDIDAGQFAPSGQSGLTRDWVQQGLPLVVARQCSTLRIDAHQILLGFTLPSAPARTRVSLRADRAAIIRHSRPLPLSDAMRHAPQSWQPGLNLLLALFERTGTVARVYGSLSSQVFTGRHYLDAASDLDLLLECGDTSKLAELLAGLQNFPLPLPHIDGEVLAASGWAVAWRELASALLTDNPRHVLVKSDRETCLLPLDEFVQPFLVSA